MFNFIKGQIVRYKTELWVHKGGNLSNKQFYSSQHQLSFPDIERGYYFSLGDKINLTDVIVIDMPHRNTDILNGQLKGKFMQPISETKYIKQRVNTHKVQMYINWKGNKTLIRGYYNKGVVYFIGLNGNKYKVKSYVDSEGYLKGLFTSPLTPKQKLNSTRVRL